MNKCDELGHSVAVSCTTGEHFCLRCNQPIEITHVGGIDTTVLVEHVMQNTTHPIGDVKLTKAMIDELASNVGKLPPESERTGSKREWELLFELHEACAEIKAYQYAVKVLAERLYYFAGNVADSHSSGDALAEDPIDFIDDCLREEDDKVHDSEIASDAVMKAAAEYEARHGRKQ